MGGRRPLMRVITKRIKKTTNRIHAIWVAAPAMPLSPRTPAISPMIRKVMLQLSISSFSLRDRTANSDSRPICFLTCDSGLRRPLIMLASAKSQPRLRIGLTRKARGTFRKGKFDCANELRRILPVQLPGLYLPSIRQTSNASSDNPASIQ
jgi:hypothetical protein